MTRILVLYYSMYGLVETMSSAVQGRHMAGIAGKAGAANAGRAGMSALEGAALSPREASGPRQPPNN
jgi:hypothetical protein